MGCSLASSLVARIKGIGRKLSPDYLFIEPSEVVVTQELHQVARMALRDVSFHIGPFLTLVDGGQFSFAWQERQKLVLGQMESADLVALSRADRVDDDGVETIRQTLSKHCDALVYLSVHRSDGIQEVMDAIR